MFKRNLFFSGIFFIITIFSSCCSSSKETKADNTSFDSPKNLISIPPGTADIKAEVLKFSEGQTDYICKLKIKEVIEYGASVPMLPPSTEIETFLNKNLLENRPKKIKEGEIIFARISQTIVPGDKEYWTIIMFNKNK